MTRNRFPLGKAGGKSGARTLNATAYSYFVAALLKGDATRPKLQQETGMGQILLGRLINTLRERGKVPGHPKHNRVLHITSWQLDARGYPTLKAYTLGPGADAPQPKKSRQQVVRDYLQRRKLKQQQGTNDETSHSGVDRKLAAQRVPVTNPGNPVQGPRVSPRRDRGDAQGNHAG